MRKILFLMLLVVFIQTGIAQESRTSHLFDIYIGIGKSGIIGGESWVDPVGFMAGVETRIISFSNQAFIRGGLGFSLQGAGYEESTVSGSVRLSYLNLPVLFTYKGKGKIFGEVGLQPGFLLSAKDKYDGESYDYKDHVNSFELGLPLGVGYAVNDKIHLGIRFTYGLTNLSSSGHGTDHNYLIVGMLAYTFKICQIEKPY